MTCANKKEFHFTLVNFVEQAYRPIVHTLWTDDKLTFISPYKSTFKPPRLIDNILSIKRNLGFTVKT